MRHRPSLTIASLLLAAALLPSGLVGARGGGPSGTDEGPVATTAPDDPFGLPDVDPIDGGAPIPDPSVEIVHRWAITPEGANDANAVSTRSELSYTGEPGSVIEDGVTVFNLGNEVLTFRIYGTDAVNTPDGSFSLLPRTEASSDVGTWVTVGQEHVTIAPGKAATIQITIAVPEGAAPGDHVGGVVASSPTFGETDDGSRVELDRGIGTRIYLRVPGELRPELAVEDLSVAYSGRLNPLGGAATASYRVQNRGNVRIDGTYRAWVSGPFGIGRTNLAWAEFTELLPGQSIEVESEFSGVPALGFVNAGVDIEATAVGGADAGDRASTSAAAIPVTVLLLLLLALAGGFVSVRVRRHRTASSGAAALVLRDPAGETVLFDAAWDDSTPAGDREHQPS